MWPAMKKGFAAGVHRDVVSGLPGAALCAVDTGAGDCGPGGGIGVVPVAQAAISVTAATLTERSCTGSAHSTGQAGGPALRGPCMSSPGREVGARPWVLRGDLGVRTSAWTALEDGPRPREPSFPRSYLMIARFISSKCDGASLPWAGS